MMYINVKVHTNSRQRREIIVDANELYNVYINVSPVDGKANKEVIELLSEYFKIAKSMITIKRGLKSSNKVIVILK